MLFRIALTIALVWFVAGVIGLILQSNRMRPNVLTGLTFFCAAVLVYYLWLGNLRP
jgi:multisubunit Na+/H+ antiporter MnhC subunit